MKTMIDYDAGGLLLYSLSLPLSASQPSLSLSLGQKPKTVCSTTNLEPGHRRRQAGSVTRIFYVPCPSPSGRAAAY